MARLPYRDASDLAPADRDLLKRPINLHRALVNNPGAARAFGVLGGYIRHEGTLDPRLRELAILQVGWTARSPYEWSHHVKIGFDFGVSEDDVRALIAHDAGDATALAPLDKAVLVAARHLTTQAELTDAQFADLRAHLSEPDLVELILVIGFYAGVIRILAGLRIDVEPEYQPYLDRFPLPR
jgi:alkylhydroperoxidase family enzyme